MNDQLAALKAELAATERKQEQASGMREIMEHGEHAAILRRHIRLLETS